MVLKCEATSILLFNSSPGGKLSYIKRNGKNNKLIVKLFSCRFVCNYSSFIAFTVDNVCVCTNKLADMFSVLSLLVGYKCRLHRRYCLLRTIKETYKLNETCCKFKFCHNHIASVLLFQRAAAFLSTSVSVIS